MPSLANINFACIHIKLLDHFELTHLRLANNVGIIDAGYRGHLMGMFDVLYHDHDLLTVNKFDRLLQICGPELVPIYVELVESKEELGVKTIRGDGGFGSTGI